MCALPVSVLSTWSRASSAKVARILTRSSRPRRTSRQGAARPTRRWRSSVRPTSAGSARLRRGTGAGDAPARGHWVNGSLSPRSTQSVIRITPVHRKNSGAGGIEHRAAQPVGLAPWVFPLTSQVDRSPADRHPGMADADTPAMGQSSDHHRISEIVLARCWQKRCLGCWARRCQWPTPQWRRASGRVTAALVARRLAPARYGRQRSSARSCARNRPTALGAQESARRGSPKEPQGQGCIAPAKV